MSTFGKKVTSAVAALAVVFSIVSPIAGVSAASDALGAAGQLSSLGIIEDHSANTSMYRVADQTSREETTKIIANLGGLTVVEGESIYADLDFASWSEKYAKALNEAGYAASNEYFNPKNASTKIEALKWVMEARGIATGTGSDWMAARVNGAVSAGIAESFTDYNAPVTRGQLFIWAANAINMEEDVVNDDELLCALLDNCEDDSTVDPVEPTDPVVVVPGSDMLEASLSPLSPTSGLVAAGKDRTTLVAFDVTAGSSDVTLDEVVVSYIGLSDAADFDNLAVYMGNDKITKQSSKGFDSDDEAELTFENDVVIQAGETQTLMVTGLVSGGTANVSHQVEVANIEASSTVTLGTIKSAVFNVVNATNTASLDIDVDTETSTPTLGETVTLADITLEEKNDEEDVMVKSLTFEFSGGFDAEDDLADIVLLADGVEIASGLMVNDDDEVVIDVDYTVAADESVDFELEGVLTGSIGDTLVVELTDVYAIGADTGIIATLTGDLPDYTVANFATVDGAEINVSFDKSDIDEAKPDAEGVLVGTLTMEGQSDYTVTMIEVTVDTSAGTVNAEDLIKELELDGDTADNVVNGNTQMATYEFTDISLDAGVEKMLDLTVDFEDATSLNGEEAEFTIKIVEVEDEDNDETFNATSTPDLNSVLSSNSFDDHTIEVETANYELVQTNISQRDLVLGNGIEVVLYQGKLSVGDADSVTFKDIAFQGTVTTTGAGFDLEDVIDQATLNIGGITDNESPDTNEIKFTGFDVEVAAGADNVDVLLTAVLKDNDDVVNGDNIFVTLVNGDVEAKDSDNEDLETGADVVTAASSNTVVELNDRGTFKFEIVNGGENEDDIEEVVLAGTSGVALAEIEIEAEEENMEVEELILTIAGTKDTTVSNVRIMNGSTVVADGAVVTTDGTNTTVKFDDGFTIEDTGSEIDAVLVADLEIITTEGGVASAEAGDITVQLVSATDIEVKGESSNDDIEVGTGLTINLATISDAVEVVPALVTVAVDQELDTDEEEAQISFTVDRGSNDLDDDDVSIVSIEFTSTSDVANIINVENDEGTDLTFTVAGSILTITSTGNDIEINTGDVFDITVDPAVEPSKLEIVENGVIFSVNGGNVESSNDNEQDLGTYKDSTN